MPVFCSLIDKCSSIVCAGLLTAVKLESDFRLAREMFEGQLLNMSVSELCELSIEYLILRGYGVGKKEVHDEFECVNIYLTPAFDLTLHGLAIPLLTGQPSLAPLSSLLYSLATRYCFFVLLFPLVELKEVTCFGENVRIVDHQEFLRTFVGVVAYSYAVEYLFSLAGLGLKERLSNLLATEYELRWDEVRQTHAFYKVLCGLSV